METLWEVHCCIQSVGRFVMIKTLHCRIFRSHCVFVCFIFLNEEQSRCAQSRILACLVHIQIALEPGIHYSCNCYQCRNCDINLNGQVAWQSIIYQDSRSDQEIQIFLFLLLLPDILSVPFLLVAHEAQGLLSILCCLQTHYLLSLL